MEGCEVGLERARTGRGNEGWLECGIRYNSRRWTRKQTERCKEREGQGRVGPGAGIGPLQDDERGQGQGTYAGGSGRERVAGSVQEDAARPVRSVRIRLLAVA